MNLSGGDGTYLKAMVDRDDLMAGEIVHWVMNPDVSCEIPVNWSVKPPSE